MLYHKHLKPWLLIYLIVGVLLFLSNVGIVVIIVLNEINGFNFTPVQFSTCSTYTNLKLGLQTELMLQVCFVMSCLAIVFSLGQCAIVVWQFLIFRKSASEDNQDEDQLFEDLTLKKLILLYFLNALGFLALITIVGSFGTFYIELRNCSGSQNQSEKYIAPGILASLTLLLQVLSFSILLKLFYHFHQDQKEDSIEATSKTKQKQKAFETLQTRKQLQKKQLQEIKKRILQSRKFLENEKNQNDKNVYDLHPTSRSMNNAHDQLLNKILQENQGDNIYGMENRLQENLPQNIQKSKQEDANITNFQNPNANAFHKNDSLNINDAKRIDRDLNQNYSFEDNNNIGDYLLSPNDIGQEQRQIIKKIPKNGYKKNKVLKNHRKNVIFEEQNEYIEKSENHEEQNRKHRKIQKYILEDEESKAEIQIEKLKKLIDKPSSIKNENFQIFKTKYHLIMSLMKNKKTSLSSSERRCIKRSLLKINTKTVQFDGNKLDVEDFEIQFQTKKSNPGEQLKNQELLAYQFKFQNRTPKGNLAKKQEKQSEVTGQISLQVSPQKILRFKDSRSATEMWQQGFTEGKKTQSFNPIDKYVEQGDNYEQKIRKILQFDQICAQQKPQKYDPFQYYRQKGKESKEKLYLHKNKPKLGRFQYNEDEKEQYADKMDPFKDMVFETDWFMTRGLLTGEDTNQNTIKSQKRGLVDGIISTAQPIKRANNRKEGGLVELIRGKHPITFI